MSTLTLTTWREEHRRKTVGALIASVVIHFLIILLVMLALAFRPPVFAPQAAEAPAELTIVAPPAEPKQKPSYVRDQRISTGRQAS